MSSQNHTKPTPRWRNGQANEERLEGSYVSVVRSKLSRRTFVMRNGRALSAHPTLTAAKRAAEALVFADAKHA